VRYVADDGTEFESEKECLEYESEQADIESSFILYDEKLEKLSPENADCCFYVNVLRRAADVANYLYNQYGLGMNRDDISKEGSYLYNDDGRFQLIDDLFCYHCEQARRFQRIRKKLLVLAGREEL
jgi:hypothetical protein